MKQKIRSRNLCQMGLYETFNFIANTENETMGGIWSYYVFTDIKHKMENNDENKQAALTQLI